MSAHEPPSAPTSPLAKRYKADPMDETMQDSTQAQSTIQLPAISSMLHPLDADIHGDRQFGGSGQFANMTPTPAALAMAGMGDSIPLQVKRLSPKAKLPTRGSEFAAGYDIYSAEDTVVPARGQVMLSTGIAIAVPPGTCRSTGMHCVQTRKMADMYPDGRVAPRSGLAVKHGIATGAGVIDYDYRGEVKLLLFNHSAADFQVREGDRMAQLVLEKITTPEVREVEVLPETSRGAGGFGSTGGFGPAI